jgi:Flp pilus assembly protein TadG
MTIRNGLRKIGSLFGQRGEEGSALVEFALTLPMLFGLIYLAASLTLGMYNLQQLGNATSATAMAVGNDVGLYPSDDPCAYAETTMVASLPNWTAANFTYKLTVTDTSDTTHPYSGSGTSFSCPLGSVVPGPNYPVTLTVSYTYTWLGIPALPFFHPGTSTAGKLVSSQSAIQM